MTEIQKTALTISLRASTKTNSKARALGEWWLARDMMPLSTGDLADWGRGNFCSSVMERLRLDLRKRCGWPIVYYMGAYRILLDGYPRRWWMDPLATRWVTT